LFCFTRSVNAQVFILFGTQDIAKFNETTVNKVEVHLAVVRLPDVTTDLLVTLNHTIEISQQSSSVGAPISGREEKLAEFTAIVKTLNIIDWGLFGA